MKFEVLTKCGCGGEVISYPLLFECKSCDTKIWKNFFGKEIKENEAKKLFKGETIVIKGLKSSNNTLYNTKAKIEQKELKLIFDDETAPTTMFLCSCKGEVVKIKGGYKCTSCEKIVWERFLNKMLTFAQVKRLFKGESLKLSNIKSSRGNIFNAEIFYEGKELSLEYL